MSAPNLPGGGAVPGVQMVAPPTEHLGPITKAIEDFSKATLGPGDKGGILFVTTARSDGTITGNLAVIGEKNDVLAWVGKQGSWGKPWEAGFAWRHRFTK